MPKPPAPVQRAEFERLTVFVQTIFKARLSATVSIPAEDQPAAVAARLWTASPAKALQGLRAAPSDMVEMTQDLKATPLAELEASLAASGAPSLASLRGRRLRSVFQILHRGRIRNDDEWRLLNTVVSDVDDRTLDPSS